MVKRKICMKCRAVNLINAEICHHCDVYLNEDNSEFKRVEENTKFDGMIEPTTKQEDPGIKLPKRNIIMIENPLHRIQGKLCRFCGYFNEQSNNEVSLTCQRLQENNHFCERNIDRFALIQRPIYVTGKILIKHHEIPIVLDGNQEFVFGRANTTIPEVLANSMISRQHIKIIMIKQDFFILDISRYGTKLNYKTISNEKPEILEFKNDLFLHDLHCKIILDSSEIEGK